MPKTKAEKTKRAKKKKVQKERLKEDLRTNEKPSFRRSARRKVKRTGRSI